MTYQITKLTKADYTEATLFLSMAFNGIEDINDLPAQMPSIFGNTEQQMNCLYAIKVEGKIRSMIGIYPSELIFGDDKLKLAQIGLIATELAYRNQSMITSLLNFAVEEIKNNNFDLAYAIGERTIFNKFGFEKMGAITFYQNYVPLYSKHCNISQENLTFETADEIDLETANLLNGLYQKQATYLKREDQDFWTICKTGRCTPHLAKKDGRIVGYLVVTEDGIKVKEVVSESAAMNISILTEFFKGEFRIYLPLLEKSMNARMLEISEGPVLVDNDNWQIFNYAKVFTTLLKMKNRLSPLCHGEITLDVENIGSFKFKVSQDEISCKQVNQNSPIKISSKKLCKMAFALPAFYAVEPLSEELQILQKWFPLPLSLCSQNIITEYQKPPYKLSNPERFCGKYKCESANLERTIYLENGELFYWRNKESISQLQALADNELTLVGSDDFLMTFNFTDQLKSFILKSGSDEPLIFNQIE